MNSATDPFDSDDGRTYSEETCQYVKGSQEPCSICPKKITALYMCGFLQEGSKEYPVSDTPRTDAVKLNSIGSATQLRILAKELERELNTANTRSADYKHGLECIARGCVYPYWAGQALKFLQPDYKAPQ